jgi:hypothetical protein
MHAYKAVFSKRVHYKIMSNRSNDKAHESSDYDNKDSSKENTQARIMIQIERQGQKLTMQDISDILKGTGIRLDPHYGPYVVNPKLGRHLVRGLADSEAEQKAKKIAGVILFRDAKIEPI